MKKKPVPKPPPSAPEDSSKPADVPPRVFHVMVPFIAMNVRLSLNGPPTTIHLGFGGPESTGPSPFNAESEAIALATIWLPGALNGGDYAVLQGLFFPVRERLWEYLCGTWPRRYHQELWKNTRAGDVRAWCQVMETYYGGLTGREALSEPPVYRLSQTDDDTLMSCLFSRVYDWFEGELRFAKGARLEEQPEAVNRLLTIWHGRTGETSKPAFRLFLWPCIDGNPITRYLSQREETFRARSTRICEQMVSLLRRDHPEESRQIETTLKTCTDRQAKKKSS